MYRLDINHQENITPWEIPLSDRISYMLQKDDRKLCVIVYEQADTSTFRYRGYNIYQVMKESSSWKTVYFFLDELESILFHLNQIDIIVLSRTRWSQKIQRFIDKVKDSETKFLFDTDDCVFDLNRLPILMNTLNVAEHEPDYDYWFSYVSRIGFVAEQADGYISTNPFLGNVLKTKYNKESYVIPNFLNKEQISFSEQCLALKSKTKPDSKFVIGYFSGTPSHYNDFMIVYNDVMDLMKRYSDIYLHIVGFMELTEEMRPFVKAGRLKQIPLVDFITLQKLVAEVDVNIVPLEVNEFTNCKSELKFFEAAIVDMVTCASPNYTYKHAIEDGVNGFLCSQTEWYDTLKRIYLKQIDTEAIIKNAHTDVMNRYFGKNARQLIENVYNSVLAAK